MLQKLTSTHTKAQLLTGYEKLLQENKKLDTQISKLITENQTAKADLKQVRLDLKKAGVGKDGSVSFTFESIIAQLTGLQAGFGNAMSEFSSELVAEASQFEGLQLEIKSEIEQLEALHDMKITGESLGNLVSEYNEKSSLFDETMQRRREALDLEISETKLTWKNEQSEHSQLLRERTEIDKKATQREETEYQYNLELQRNRENDVYKIQQKKLYKTLDKLKENKKLEWAEKEKQIAEREKEYREIRQRVEKFPKELEGAVKKAREEAATATQREMKIQQDLQAKHIEGERRVAELKIKSLEEIIKQQVQQIQKLSIKLDVTLKQVQELAAKAIEGASNVNSLQAMKQIALEQAKNAPKSN